MEMLSSLLIYRCTMFHNLDQFAQDLSLVPAGTKKLKCDQVRELKSLKGMPDSVEELMLFGCLNLTSFEGMSDSVTRLDYSYCDVFSWKGVSKNLKQLFLSATDEEEEGIDHLRGLPEGLEHITCARSCVSSLKGMPSNVKYLNIAFTPLENLDGISESIEELHCGDNLVTAIIPDSVKILQIDLHRTTSIRLPTGLKELHLTNRKNMHIDFDKLPNLEKLSVMYMIIDFEELPRNLKELSLKYIGSLETLRGCPAVKKLDYSGGTVTSLKGLPEGILELNIDNSEIESLKYCPQSVVSLDCGYTRITSFKGISKSCKKLICKALKLEDFQYLPDGIETIDATFCNVSSLKGMPDTVTELAISNAKELESLQHLPKGLIKLDCEGSGIQSLEGIPRSLEYLNCSQCNNLSTLEGIPKNSRLKEVLCNRCLHLESLAGLPATVKILDCRWSSRLRPNIKMLFIKQLKFSLEAEIQKYKKMTIFRMKLLMIQAGEKKEASLS